MRGSVENLDPCRSPLDALRVDLHIALPLYSLFDTWPFSYAHWVRVLSRLRHPLWLWPLLLLCLHCVPAPRSTPPASRKPPTTQRPISRGGPTLRIVFFDIGQGDAAMVLSPTGKRVLIDAGPPDGAQALLENLEKRAVDRLDLLLLSHPHLDHFGGMKRVLAQIPATVFMDAGYDSTSPPYAALLRDLSTRGIAVKQAKKGRVIDLGDGAELRLLSPPDPFLQNTRSDVNANSVVAKISWRGRTALLTGDAEPETERWLLAEYAQTPDVLRSEVLKVAHHGGKYSSTAPFLRAVSPSVAVISCAAQNDYGHPTQQALDRLSEAGALVHRTDQEGTISIETDGTSWQVSSDRDALPAEHQPPRAPTPTQPPQPVPTVPSPAPTDSQPFAASRRSQVFHRATCAAVRAMVPANLLTFPSRAAAVASQRQPAQDCNP